MVSEGIGRGRCGLGQAEERASVTTLVPKLGWVKEALLWCDKLR